MADKNYQSMIVLSKLNAGAWDATAQTKAIPAVVAELTPDYGIESRPVLCNIEGESKVGFTSSKAVNMFTIKGDILQEDLELWLSDFLVSGAQLGVFFGNENKWGKGYLTRYKIISSGEGAIPTFEADIWTEALASMSAPTLEFSSAKQLNFSTTYVDGQTLYSLEAEFFNNRNPKYLLSAGLTSNYPNGVENVERDGNISFTVNSDSIATFDNLAIASKPTTIDGLSLVVGSGTGAATITLTSIVVNEAIKRTFQYDTNEKIYSISARICNDNTNPPYSVAIA